MPLYEYYCGSCEGVFELLRPARDAALPQPCPVCDEDARRIVSREWSAFIFRDGYARRLPDDGGYWHLGKKVRTAITSSPDGITHPELAEPPEIAAPSVEELEHFEYQQEMKAAVEDPDMGFTIHDDAVRAEKALKKRMVKTKGTPLQEAAKRRVLRVERGLAKKKQSRA